MRFANIFFHSIVWVSFDWFPPPLSVFQLGAVLAILGFISSLGVRSEKSLPEAVIGCFLLRILEIPISRYKLIESGPLYTEGPSVTCKFSFPTRTCWREYSFPVRELGTFAMHMRAIKELCTLLLCSVSLCLCWQHIDLIAVGFVIF